MHAYICIVFAACEVLNLRKHFLLFISKESYLKQCEKFEGEKKPQNPQHLGGALTLLCEISSLDKSTACLELLAQQNGPMGFLHTLLISDKVAGQRS